MPRLKQFVYCALILVVLVSAASCRKSQITGQADATIEEKPPLLTMVRVADPKASAQLVKGFHAVEGNNWRWTMGRFSVLLSPPPGSGDSGARLVLRFSIPEPVLKALTTVRLSAKVGDVPLPAQEYRTAGEQVYTRDVPPQALAKSIVPVDFVLDKFMPPGKVDQRELGVVVTVVGLEPR
ncbi:MAG: hypothetical protein ACE141_04410 [Bryobacteraceae bacterium]